MYVRRAVLDQRRQPLVGALIDLGQARIRIHRDQVLAGSSPASDRGLEQVCSGWRRSWPFATRDAAHDLAVGLGISLAAFGLGTARARTEWCVLCRRRRACARERSSTSLLSLLGRGAANPPTAGAGGRQPRRSPGSRCTSRTTTSRIKRPAQRIERELILSALDHTGGTTAARAIASACGWRGQAGPLQRGRAHSRAER